MSGTDSYSDVFGKELVHLAQQDVRICAITAAMEHGTGLHHFARKYPNRYYDVGIAEQHAVTYSAALAAAGQLPVFAVYSSFLQRGYDQLMHDVALSGQHVVLGIDRAGVVGEDGETHHGLYDVSYLSTVPGAVIYAPACYDELRLCLRRALYRDHGLACVRYPRGADHSVFDKTALNTEYTHVSGAKTDVLYVSYGRVYDALYRASSRAREQGMNCDLLKLTRIFPLSDMAVEIAMSYRQVIFLEEAYYYGGISQLMGDALLERGFTGKYRRIAPKAYLPQASMESQMEQMHLSEHAIFQDMQQVFQEKRMCVMQRLDLAVVQAGLAPSRQRAKALISGGQIQVNGKVCSKPAFGISESDQLELIGSDIPFVGRGGLEAGTCGKHAASGFQRKDVPGYRCIHRGIYRLHAATWRRKGLCCGRGTRPAGTHTSCRSPCFVLGRDRHPECQSGAAGKAGRLFSVDVSFISLEYVLPAAAALLASGGMAVVLIKPQFEAGKENIGKNGLVLSKKVHETVLYRMLGLFRTLGLSLQMLCPSPIQGGSGNIEYLAAVQKSDAPPCSMDLREVIEQAFSAKRGKKEKAK